MKLKIIVFVKYTFVQKYKLCYFDYAKNHAYQV